MDSGYETSALIIVLPKRSVRKFLDEFSKHVLQQDEFSKCIFHLGPVFFRTSFPYTDFPPFAKLQCADVSLPVDSLSGVQVCYMEIALPV